MDWINAIVKLPKNREFVLLREHEEIYLAYFNADKGIFVFSNEKECHIPLEKLKWSEIASPECK